MAERTPSPAPEPPQSQPGPRASRLQSLLSSAISHTSGALTYRQFAACFPTPAEYSVSSLQDFHRTVTNKFAEISTFELDAIIKDRNVVAALNELDEALNTAKQQREKFLATTKGDPREAEANGAPVPPHTLPAEVVMAAHMGGLMKDQTREMSERLTSVQKENLVIAEDIKAQRREMTGMISDLEMLVADLESAANEIPRELRGWVEEAATADQR